MGADRIFDLRTPAAIHVGWGMVEKTGEKLKRLGISRVLIVTEQGIKRAGLLEPLAKSLKENGTDFDVFAEVEPNPSVEQCVMGLGVLRQVKPQAIVAIGGGSAIDAAKTIRMMQNNHAEFKEYIGFDKVANPPEILLVAIPTTSGTGAEATMWAVISIPEENLKVAVGTPFNLPDMAIIDPQLVASLPPRTTAATGIDALSHCIEAFVSKSANIYSKMFSREGIRLIFKFLPAAVQDGSQKLPRYKMAIAALYGGLAVNNASVGLLHALASPLGARYHTAHGETIGVMLPPCMEFNIARVPEKYAELAGIMGAEADDLPAEPAAKLSVQQVVKLRDSLGLASRLSELGAVAEGLEDVARISAASGNMKGNPCPASAEEILSLFKATL